MICIGKTKCTREKGLFFTTVRFLMTSIYVRLNWLNATYRKSNKFRLSLHVLLAIILLVKQYSSDNRPFAGSGHMVRNKLRWDANDAVGLSKQRKVGLDWYEFLCFGSPTASFASQRNLFRTM